MDRRISTTLGAVVAIAGIALLARSLREPFSGIRISVNPLEDIAPLPESVQTSAVDQVTRVKGRGAVESMKADLRNLVKAEEAYFAESLKYSSNVGCNDPPTPGTVALCTGPGNMLYAPVVTWGPPGWKANITNEHSTIWCFVVVGPDTSIAHAPSGEPVCTSGPWK